MKHSLKLKNSVGANFRRCGCYRNVRTTAHTPEMRSVLFIFVGIKPKEVHFWTQYVDSISRFRTAACSLLHPSGQLDITMLLSDRHALCPNQIAIARRLDPADFKSHLQDADLFV